MQEVFIKTWEKREQIGLEQSFTSYLFKISKHMVYSALRKENVEKKLKDYLSFIGTEIYTHVEEALAYKQSEIFVLESIEKLPPQ
ncbi:RNA polymerase sigma factor [Mucilaginibacter endophyticus]|uniref:RNA polymerase sigma factor n=1 Tax=Mucilaginibacter endophyticus TaxID=2675003 RepID=UPI001FCA0CB8|nr:sigma factor [Mucilaginibacter endophyticus]